MQSAPLRAGIIGGGFMAQVHSRAVRAAGHHVVGMSTSTPERSRIAASRLGIPRSFDSAAELIASTDLDVVHVCTPNNLHFALSKAAIAAGKPVICEKPLAMTAAEAGLLVEQAREGSVPTMVPFVYRYYPIIREIRSRIASGEAGELLLLHGSYLQDWLATEASTNWRVDANQGGSSRAFADVGVHWCDLMEFVTGHRIARLTANLSTAYGKRGISDTRFTVGTEDLATVLFETDQGTAGSLTVSQISRGRKNRLWFSFDGTKGSYEFNQEEPDRVWIGGTAENRMITSGTSGVTDGDARRLAFLPAGHPQGYQDAFDALIADTYRSFAGAATEALPTFTDGYRAARITQAVLLASSTRTWIDVLGDEAPINSGTRSVPA